MFLVFAGHGES